MDGREVKIPPPEYVLPTIGHQAVAWQGIDRHVQDCSARVQEFGDVRRVITVLRVPIDPQAGSVPAAREPASIADREPSSGGWQALRARLEQGPQGVDRVLDPEVATGVRPVAGVPKVEWPTSPEASFLSQADLFRRAADGDRAAFDAIDGRCRGPLLRFLGRRYRRLDLHTIEDVCGEVFLRAWRERHRLASVRHVLAYLKGIAQNVVARRYRRDRPDEDELPRAAVSRAPSPDAMVQQDELADQITLAAGSLAASHRLVMELAQEDLSARQIASVAHCTEKAVRRRLAKARRHMRIALSRCGDACALDDCRPEECPARRDEAWSCLKFLYWGRSRDYQKCAIQGANPGRCGH